MNWLRKKDPMPGHEIQAHLENGERDKMARLEKAERDVADLTARKNRAIGILDTRHRRNHWREGITQMIQGA